MSYKALSNEYIRQYKFLSVYVKKLNIDFNKTYIKLNTKEITNFKKRIHLIYTMCLELKHVGEYLKKCEKRELKCPDKN